jgi:HxlR-like helix-turn-helix/SCP-2 sterol transfer family
MVADGMLTRKRYREVPPRVDYELTERARELMPILGELARWGYEWAWSTPRSHESVDIGAIFRLAPGLLQPVKDLQGTIELNVTDGKDGEGASYSLNASGDQISIEEKATERPDAKVSGDTAAWVAALSPDHDRSGLQVTGDRAIVERLLDSLVASGRRAAASSVAA